MNNFIKAIDFTLGWEVGRDKKGNLKADGGYTNDPTDPGGETKWGISKRAHPNEDIKNMTLDRAFVIYKEEYYDIYKQYKQKPLDLDASDMCYAIVIFDTGVNLGVNRTYSFHLKAVETKDPVKTLLGLRDAHYTNLKAGTSWGAKYYNGWIRRLNDLKKLVEILGNDQAGQA